MSGLVRSVDVRTLQFGPLGLGGPMPADVKERLLTGDVEALRLADNVPSHLHSQFDKLTRLYTDGLYSYDSFTVAMREAYRVLEAALKVRLLEHYAYRIPVVTDGRPERIACRFFEDLRALLVSRRRRCRLAGHDGFDGSFAALLRWARAEGYFYGQGNRFREDSTAATRNDLQHAELDYVHMPPDSYGTIELHYEWIQRLWGHFTPGGVAYPGPVARRPYVVGHWHESGAAIWFPLELLPDAKDCDPPGGVFDILLAGDGERLYDWRPDAERTTGPAGHLWGPGSLADLLAAVDSYAGWPEDSVETLDRVFYVQVVDGAVGPSRVDHQVARLNEPVRGERWYVVRADMPGMARHHVMELLDRDRQDPEDRHNLEGPCQRCAAESIFSGARRHTVDNYIRRSRRSVPPVV
jgi:hypothetical protein